MFDCEEIVLYQGHIGIPSSHIRIFWRVTLNRNEIISCNCRLTVNHTIADCPHWAIDKYRFYRVRPTLSDLFGSVSPNKVSSFLQYTNLYTKSQSFIFNFQDTIYIGVEDVVVVHPKLRQHTSQWGWYWGKIKRKREIQLRFLLLVCRSYITHSPSMYIVQIHLLNILKNFHFQFMSFLCR